MAKLWFLRSGNFSPFARRRWAFGGHLHSQTLERISKEYLPPPKVGRLLSPHKCLQTAPLICCVLRPKHEFLLWA